MSGEPQVTVVIATRDRWPLLERTLAAVFAQEGITFEVIVVDDGSVDVTPARLAEIDDARLRVIRHPASRGVAVARNAAIGVARGDWLAFLDDDDLWSPEKLRIQVGDAIAHEAVWAYGTAVAVDERLRLLDVILAPDPDGLMGRLIQYNPIPAGASNVVARTSVVRDLGAYDETLSQLADWDLWIRLALAGPAVACSEPLIAYVQHGGGMLVSDRQGAVDEFERLARKHARLAAEQGVEFDRAGLTAWIAWADSRSGRRLRAASGYLRAALIYARRRVLWAARANVRHATDALRGRVLTDTGRRAAHESDAEAPAWLAPFREGLVEGTEER